MFEDGSEITIALYVDDLICSTNKPSNKEWLKEKLEEVFTVSSGPLDWCLGMGVTCNALGIHLSQTAYIEGLYENFGKDGKENQYSVPMDPASKLGMLEGPPQGSDAWKKAQELPYRSIVGGLLYATITRPDIQFAVGLLCSAGNNWTVEHYRAAVRVVRYLHQTKNFGLQYHKDGKMELNAFSDAEFAGQHKDGKSVGGFTVRLGGSIICCSSKKQTVVALSTAAAEYYALSSVCVEILMLRYTMGFLGFPQREPTLCYVDSTAAKAIAEKVADTKKSKTIDVRYAYVNDMVKRGIVQLAYIVTDNMLADIFTKPLPRDTFEKHRASLVGGFSFMLKWTKQLCNCCNWAR